VRRAVIAFAGKVENQFPRRQTEGANDEEEAESTQPGPRCLVRSAVRCARRLHAHDKTTGVPVTNFLHSTKLYNLAMSYNRGLDRDKDGIACEKH
jgi:excalibur calcium-binding domain-containing protein